MKNAFYVTLKTLFVLKVFKFLSWRLVHVEKRLYEKVKFITCSTHIAQISRSKGSQTMKFGQLIEYNMKNISVEKLYTKCGAEKLFPDPFLKNQNWIF